MKKQNKLSIKVRDLEPLKDVIGGRHAEGSHRKQSNQAGKEPKMKPWTTEFVTSLWASGGFDGIAELHNRELGWLKGKMNNNSGKQNIISSELLLIASGH